MLKVYFSDITNFSSDINTVSITDKARVEYLSTFTSVKRKMQSVLAWKLLEYSLSKLGFFDLEFENQNGRWVEKLGLTFISISHSNNLVCVAISDKPIGIDVEKVCEKAVIVGKKIFPNICCEKSDEFEFYTKLWTEKESLFKCGEEGVFSSFAVYDKNNEKYFISICTKNKVNSLEFVELDKYIKE